MPAVNPYIDAGPFGACSIGGVPLAGVIVAIDGAEKPEDWTFQKGTSGNNAVSIWNGTKLAEQITLTINLYNAEQWTGHEAVRLALRPKAGDKPPSLPIVNAIINSEGIVTVARRSAPPALWIRSGGFWQAKIVLCEFNPPKPARAGRAKPAQYTEGPAPKTAAEREFERLAREAAAL